MCACKADRLDCAPWCLNDGDTTYVQIDMGEEGENKTKPKVGTLYSLIKPLEKAVAQKGASFYPNLLRPDRGKRSGWKAWIWL